MGNSFRIHLTSELNRICKVERISLDKAFLFWFALTVLELSEEEAREAISVEGANDKGIDLLAPRCFVWVNLGDLSPKPPGIYRFET